MGVALRLDARLRDGVRIFSESEASLLKEDEAAGGGSKCDL